MQETPQTIPQPIYITLLDLDKRRDFFKDNSITQSDLLALQAIQIAQKIQSGEPLQATNLQATKMSTYKSELNQNELAAAIADNMSWMAVKIMEATGQTVLNPVNVSSEQTPTSIVDVSTTEHGSGILIDHRNIVMSRDLDADTILVSVISLYQPSGVANYNHIVGNKSGINEGIHFSQVQINKITGEFKVHAAGLPLDKEITDAVNPKYFNEIALSFGSEKVSDGLQAMHIKQTSS